MPKCDWLGDCSITVAGKMSFLCGRPPLQQWIGTAKEFALKGFHCISARWKEWKYCQNVSWGHVAEKCGHGCSATPSCSFALPSMIQKNEMGRMLFAGSKKILEICWQNLNTQRQWSTDCLAKNN